MKADITRSTFRKKKHYRKVNMQQGRVQIDADWNEQIDIQVYHDITSLQDIIGKTGTLIDEPGFEIKASTNGYTIGASRYYVDGILCENENEIEATNQKDLPEFADKNKYAVPKTEGIYLVYLDVWERHLTALDDSDIREVALGGADTATRTKTVWQVKVFRVGNVGESYNCLSSFPSWDQEIAESTGKFRARAQPTKKITEPCELPPEAGYQGIENHLYRVEIHDGGTTNNTTTFKWSRDNGMVVSKVTSIDSNEKKIITSDAGKDSKLGFAAGQWVEVIDNRRELWGLPGTLVELDEVKGNTLIFKSDTIKGDDITNDNFPQEFNPNVRRWDSAGPLAVEIPSENDGYIELEDGVQIKFENGVYKTGDYCLVPARMVEPYVIWPETDSVPDALPPEGIKHHYAPLALLKYEQNNTEVISDCREFFPCVTDLPILYYVSGDGQEAAPDSVLPFPLMAYVAIDKASLKNWKVRFKIKVGEGKLGSTHEDTTHNPFDATISDTGFVECYWILDDKNPKQQVEAVLLDADGNEVNSPPLYFDATLPISFYYVSGDGLEVAAGSSIELAAGAVIGKTPLQDRKVRFTVTDPTTGIIPTTGTVSGGGTVNPAEPSTDVNGIAKCVWKLGTASKQQVKAVLLDIDGKEVNLSPVYFNATIAEVPQTISANTGIIILQLKQGREFLFGPFKHGLEELLTKLKIKAPPAIILGKASDEPVVEYMEDHALYNFGAESYRFKPVDVNFSTFWIKMEGKFTGNEKPVMLRWWAIPAQEQKPQKGEPVESHLPSIVFDPGIITKEQPTVLTVTDANANKDLDIIEHVEVKLTTATPTARLTIEAIETGPNTGIFTQTITVVDENWVKIGNEEQKQLEGAIPGGKIVATYTWAAGQTVKAEVEIKTEGEIVKLTVKPSKTVYTRGETVNLSGTVVRGTVPLPNVPIEIRVFNPNNTMYTAASATSGIDGSYEASLELSGPLAIVGAYTVKVTSSGQTAQTKFRLTG